MRRLASWCFRHRWATVAGWFVALIALVAIHSAAGSAYTDNFKLPHTGSFDAIRLLQRSSPGRAGETDQLVFAVKQGKVTDPAVRARAQALFAKLTRLPDISTVGSPYTPAGSKQIAPGGQIAFANITFSNAANQNRITATQAQTFVHTITSASGNGVEFEAEGNIAEAGNTNNQGSGLLFGFIAAAIVLFIVFGSFVAMMLPLIAAGLSLGSGVSVVGLLSHVISIATFSNQLALLIGLGVGVDYALFIVTRYKQALSRGETREAAVVEALDTSGRAVLFAGMIVCIAMLGMFALGVSFLYGVAVAAAVTVAFTVLAALTLLPALLGILGGLVPRRRERRALKQGELNLNVESPIWVRWTNAISKRPAVFAVVATLVMLVIAIPFFSMRLGSADAGTDPTSTTTRRAYDLLAKGFGPGYNGPLQLVAQIKTPTQLAAFNRTRAAVAGTPGVVGATPAVVLAPGHGRPTVAIANVYPKGSPQAASTTDLLNRVRSTVIPAATKGTGLTVLVGGTTAIFEDFSHILSAKLPLFIGIVVLLSFLLLMAVFRSLVIPLTAAVMNMLSAGAAFGVVTAIFQKGWLGGTTGPIETFVPVLMFPILFGLSMDYEVFLISRVYEEWHRRRDNTEAVAHGLAATGRTITAAAAIMVLVFASFILGGQRIIELFGVGLASAVLLDALIVRSVLVPALMMMLGERNWQLPAWLERILPHLNVEGESSRAAGEERSRAGLPEPAAG
ncbi:MAG: putative drug exporter of the superfamily [Solirubrobacteraceae bacterium]|jgi:RND superfamily putative drug exporter|nr:putative drug exporter of the superfamily [Solirubrobacteraceae bacterium]